MDNGRRERRWVNLFVKTMKTLLMATLCHRGWLLAETIGDLQSAMSILLFACYKRPVESRGSTNHSGQTAMDTSFHRDWLVFEQRVQCGNASLAKWCILQQFCFVRLFFWPDCERICVFSTVRCTICFVAAGFALWFCHWGFTLYSCKGDDIKKQRRHT